jgi:HlyD family secretion protein
MTRAFRNTPQFRPPTRWPRLALTLALLLAACAKEEAPRIQGYVEGEFVRVSVTAGGTLDSLAVRRGQSIAAGAPLFTLESANETAARREAEDRVAKADAALANLLSGKRAPEVNVVNAQLAQAQAARALSASNLARQQRLAQSGFISPSVLEDARTQLARDSAAVSELQAQVQTAKLPARDNEIRAAQAEAAAARAALAQADWRLKQRAVPAPAGGLVYDTYFRSGEWVTPGSAVVSLLPPQNIKLRFFVSEAQLGAIKPGQKVTVRCDACGEPIGAEVRYVSTQAEYTPPVLYTREQRAKLVYLVEAYPAVNDAPRLHPGQPVDVSL